MENIYFILNLPAQSLSAILQVCVEDINNLRYSLDGKKCVVKLPYGQTDIPPALNGFTQYSHAEILQIMHSDAWQDNEI